MAGLRQNKRSAYPAQVLEIFLYRQAVIEKQILPVGTAEFIKRKVRCNTQPFSQFD